MFNQGRSQRVGGGDGEGDNCAPGRKKSGRLVENWEENEWEKFYEMKGTRERNEGNQEKC